MPGRGKVEVRVLSAEETWEKEESQSPEGFAPWEDQAYGSCLE